MLPITHIYNSRISKKSVENLNWKKPLRRQNKIRKKTLKIIIIICNKK
jgi:hypothetical protein